MSKKFFEIICFGLVVILILSGCTWFDKEPDYRDGFHESDLVVPRIPPYPPHTTIQKPVENESQLPPGFKYNSNWGLSDIYALWGGFISINLENSGVNDLFVYSYGIEVNWSFPSERIYEEKNVPIPVGETRHLGVVYFDAPNTTGNFSYRIIMSLLVKDNDLFEQHGVESWYDNGTVRSSRQYLDVKPIGDANYIKIIHNYRHYYDKLNEKVDFDDAQVKNLVTNLTKPYPGGYNIYRVLTVFDFVVNNLTYISDPEGRDFWCNPKQTLARGGGDCEDLSILFSSMVGAMGGTTRIYLTNSHAFSMLYVGNESQKNEILEAINTYYGTELNFVIFEDEKGNWLAADPAGSLCMGGLPADADPALVLENPLLYGFNFIDTTEIHAIDIME